MSHPSLRLYFRHQEQSIAAGSTFLATPNAVYRDAPDQLLEQIRDEIAAGRPWRETVQARLHQTNPWLLRIVTDPARTRWLDLHPPRPGSWILDVGSGWGQWSIPAAAAGAHVVSLEPNPARLAVIRAIAKQEGCSKQMYFVGANLEDVGISIQPFDQVYCIGVLEWVPKFRPSMTSLEAQTRFLHHLHAVLGPEGTCIVGIENRLGLKYLLGANDDHTGIPGISCLDATTAARLFQQRTGQPLRVLTHSQKEYDDLFAAAGFTRTEFFAAFPDYKVAEVVLPVEDGSVDRYFLEGRFIGEHQGNNGAPLSFQTELSSHYRSLAAMGMAGQFAPSFFIRATR